ncbi:diguanylate cyclase [Pseudooceanicola sp. CBS1P-1]|uniref:diguanylate cyclase n=1 Tax=Pseudooceanicola albus TaxID=2692189 RepID=A0A6L7FZQ1_9RHOB|nr:MULTISPECIES: diguanylate cyclase [Pseudooceanicola]MBT9383730.1 diguanylate cyclase [Pseudooceanicola endophyticus]MXN17584.1 diguanylate cyclase [Pseudooceanicola albus]
MASFSLVILGMGLMALVSFAYSYTHQKVPLRWLRHVLLGFAFGGAAVISMNTPIQLGPGVILDGRSLFIGFAGFFVGPIATAISLAMAVSYRIVLSGPGMLSGISGMCIGAALGLFWSLPALRGQDLSLRRRALMGLTFGLTILPAFFLLPSDVLTRLSQLIPVMLCYYVLATMIFGGFLEFERRRARRERYLQQCVNLDPLTGVLNRAGLEEVFNTRSSEATPNGRCLLLVEIDDFAPKSRRHGRAFRETALRRTAAAIRDGIRTSDELARTGEAEFAIMLMNVDLKIAALIGQRLQKSIREFTSFTDIEISASIGATHWPGDLWTLEQALQAADSSLYEAKTMGAEQLLCRAG